MTGHQPRSYRRTLASDDLVAFEVALAETDLLILAARRLPQQARAAVRQTRRQIETHAALHPEFLSARQPLPVPGYLPTVVLRMYEAGQRADTGPMAAVAGAIAEHVARALRAETAQVIVENGGDLFLISERERLVAVRAGRSPLDGRVALAVPAGEVAVCTSSGTVGHSDSAGRADAVVVAADDGALADALATATGNRVKAPEDAEKAIAWARRRAELRHILIICGETVATWGEFEVRPIR